MADPHRRPWALSPIRTLLALLLLASGTLQAGVFEPREFASPEIEARYRQLTYELRCLVCQNQNIADSDADLASDLRREVFERLERGESNDEIIGFMTDRYGDFVLYRPPFNLATAALWGAPALLAIGGLLLVIRTFRRAPAAVPLDASEAQRLQRYLRTDGPPPGPPQSGGT